MSELSFIKMHGLGNDFVVVDGRNEDLALDSDRIRAMADRRSGIGCDQVLEILAPTSEDADAFMRIWNADGGQVEACGNGTRCVAAFLMSESGSSHIVVQTAAGLLKAETAGVGKIAVDMGPPRLDWQDIPLSREMDTLKLELSCGTLVNPVAVSMGNPHAVFIVNDVDTIDLDKLGPKLEVDPIFPQRANIGVAEIINRDAIRLRVWERGVGLTSACGTGACAAVVASIRLGLTSRSVKVRLDGGELEIEWKEDDSVRMVGPVATSFMGLSL